MNFIMFIILSICKSSDENPSISKNIQNKDEEDLKSGLKSKNELKKDDSDDEDSKVSGKKEMKKGGKNDLKKGGKSKLNDEEDEEDEDEVDNTNSNRTNGVLAMSSLAILVSSLFLSC